MEKTKPKPLAAHRARVARSLEAAGPVSECLGPMFPGVSIFCVTRGQFSMIDAILHVLDCVGPAKVSLWTWTIAAYEADVFREFMESGRITSGRLVVDADIRRKTMEGSRNGTLDDARNVGAQLVREWSETFGAGSVRLVKNHAKIATVEGGGLRVLLRGSMNLNGNPRYEQLDLTEGGPDFELVREIEEGLEILELDATSDAVSSAFAGETAFPGVSLWRP